ncbi:bifunctional oligoribonuclease/PAP phosphatase NrnA [Patescibacteria group bacterium]
MIFKKIMTLSETEQIKKNIAESKEILIITKREPSGDSLGSMLALYLVLQKLEKNVTVVSQGTPKIVYNFLPSFHQITKKLASTKDFIISLNIANAEVGEFNYRIEENQLKIYIQPKKGDFNPADVTSEKAKPKYDLVIALNCPDFAYMGKLYEENTDFFYETPVINIDHRASNENYGNINLVDVTATSTAEILYDLAKNLGENLVDEDIATCLLTGIIADTDSFQNQQTTPKALQAAAELIDLGGDQQKIVRHMYRTKNLSTLKLWGRLLARIKHDDKAKLVWTLADLPDFQKANAKPGDLEGVAEELIASSPDAEIILILVRIAPQKIKGIIHTTNNENAAKLAGLFNGNGNEHHATFELQRDQLIDTEKEVIETIRASRK